ncbi:MAG: hypothetical protein AAF551_14145, partial [Bacteroidota bacterium]
MKGRQGVILHLMQDEKRLLADAGKIRNAEEVTNAINKLKNLRKGTFDAPKELKITAQMGDDVFVYAPKDLPSLGAWMSKNKAKDKYFDVILYQSGKDKKNLIFDPDKGEDVPRQLWSIISEEGSRIDISTEKVVTFLKETKKDKTLRLLSAHGEESAWELAVLAERDIVGGRGPVILYQDGVIETGALYRGLRKKEYSWVDESLDANK